MRRFEFSEGGSQKFWEIDQNGTGYTVRFGRLGTAGQEKAHTCASADEAIAEAAALIREKTKKGYQEIGAVERNWRPPNAISHHVNATHFLNYAVSDFNPDSDPEGGDEEGGRGRKAYPTLRDLDRRTFGIGITYDDGPEVFLARLQALLDDPKVGQLKGLVIGNWFGENSEGGSDAVIEKLIAHKDRLTSLTGIFFGDIVQEESEISWINQVDHVQLLHALPRLEEYVVRGGTGLRFSTPFRHAALKGLTVHSGGLSSDCVRDIANADLPELRRLTLWLGCGEYGGEYTIDDLRPILDGKAFPKLEYLGLMNSDQSDGIATAIADAPILDRLKGLDLSMGILGDAGGAALAESTRIRKLKHLNLRHHYLSDAMAKRIRGLGVEVDLSDAEGEDEDADDRYCEVTE